MPPTMPEPEALDQTGIDAVVAAFGQAARRAAEEAQEQEGKGREGVYCGAAIQLKDGSIRRGEQEKQDCETDTGECKCDDSPYEISLQDREECHGNR